jgi:hypothetical protein
MLVRLSRPAATCRWMNTVSAGVADALVVPGGKFGPAAGLLLYAGAAGPLTDSIAVLGRVVLEMEGFLDAIDWPG